MAITKDKKVEISEKVEGIVRDAVTVVFVNFHGLPIGEEQALREKLKEEGVAYYVAKKTLVERVLGASSVSGEQPPFEGELAIAYGADAVAPARGVYQFAKSSDGKLTIRGGIFEGSFKSATEMTEIAQIPGMQELRGMFANVINSPIQGLVMALDAIAQKKTG